MWNELSSGPSESGPSGPGPSGPSEFKLNVVEVVCIVSGNILTAYFFADFFASVPVPVYVLTTDPPCSVNNACMCRILVEWERAQICLPPDDTTSKT